MNRSQFAEFVRKQREVEAPCKHGHLGDSDRVGGECLDEILSNHPDLEDVDPDDEPVPASTHPRPVYTVAFYERDRCYGGPEEGGWWYDAGELIRVSRVFKNERSAYAYAGRATDLLNFLQRNLRPVSSVAYGGGRYEARVFKGDAPKSYPSQRPHYC